MTYIQFSQRPIELVDLWALTPDEQIQVFETETVNKYKLHAWLRRTLDYPCGKFSTLDAIQNYIDTFAPKARRKGNFRASNDYFDGKSPFEHIMEHGDQAYKPVLGCVEYRSMIFRDDRRCHLTKGDIEIWWIRLIKLFRYTGICN
jgi:hypothetical protein